MCKIKHGYMVLAPDTDYTESDSARLLVALGEPSFTLRHLLDMDKGAVSPRAANIVLVRPVPSHGVVVDYTIRIHITDVRVNDDARLRALCDKRLAEAENSINEEVAKLKSEPEPELKGQRPSE